MGTCDKCKQVQYCGRACQVIHWRNKHNTVCCLETLDEQSDAAKGHQELAKNLIVCESMERTAVMSEAATRLGLPFVPFLIIFAEGTLVNGGNADGSSELKMDPVWISLGDYQNIFSMGVVVSTNAKPAPVDGKENSLLTSILELGPPEGTVRHIESPGTFIDLTNQIFDGDDEENEGKNGDDEEKSKTKEGKEEKYEKDDGSRGDRGNSPPEDKYVKVFFGEDLFKESSTFRLWAAPHQSWRTPGGIISRIFKDDDPISGKYVVLPCHDHDPSSLPSALSVVSNQDKETNTAYFHVDGAGKTCFTKEEAERTSNVIVKSKLVELVKSHIKKLPFELRQRKETVEHFFCNESVYGNLNLLAVSGVVNLASLESLDSTDAGAHAKKTGSKKDKELEDGGI